jgi:hypothetical protein
MRSPLCFLLTRLATIVGSLTLLAFMLLTVTLDPSRPARVLNALVTSDAGRRVATQVLADQITHYDPSLSHDQATALAGRVTSDPHLPAALAVAEHGNPNAALDAVLTSVGRYDPAAAAAIRQHLPHGAGPSAQLVPKSVSTPFNKIRGKLAAGIRDGLLAAIALALAALLIGPSRDRVARRLGWWCVLASIFQVAFWAGLPRLLDRLHGQWPVLVAIALRAAGSTVVGTFELLLLAGVGLLGFGYLGRLARPLAAPRRARVSTPAAPPPAPHTTPYYRSPANVYNRDLGPGEPTRSWRA